MSYNIVIASEFAKEAKRIAKKHPGIKADITKLISDLKLNPRSGTDLGQGFYKIRMAVSGTGKGKSSGAIVITYIIVNKETLILAEIYLKSEFDSVNVDLLIQRIKGQGFI